MNIINYLVDYFIESPLIIQVMWVMIALFIALIIYLIIYLRYLRKGLRKKDRIVVLYEQKYESYLLNYLYSGNEEEDISSRQLVIINQLKKSTKDPFIRKILISLFLKIKNEISGEIAESIHKLYLQTGLVSYALARLKHKKWYVIAKGIRELNQFNVKEAHDEVLLHINHPRREVRKEMQIYMLNLFYFEGLSFLNLLEMQLSEWDQIQLLGTLQRLKNQQEIYINPWLESANDSVVIFALKLAEIYNITESRSTILQLLNHDSKKIRLEAIRVLSHLNVLKAKEVLKENITERSQEEQIAFFKLMENLYEIKDESFVLEFVNNKIFEIKVSTLKILKRVNINKFNTLLDESSDPQFLKIITFIKNN